VCPPAPPFASWRTQSGTGLSSLEGQDANGTWTVGISDAFTGDATTLTDFELTFTLANP
jgi:subtilisin-like proprotein convertase family protein